MLAFIAFFTLFTSVFTVQELNVKELRELLYQGSENKEQAKLLFVKVGEYEGNDPLIIGFKGAAFALI